MSRIDRYLPRIAAHVWAACTIAAPVAAAPPAVVELRKVALSNTYAPGTPGDVFAPLQGIGGKINNQGQILIGASVQRTAVLPGLWLESSPGQIGLVALHNNPAPSIAGKRYDYQAAAGNQLNSSGAVAYTFGYKPFPVDNYGLHAQGIGSAIWSNSGGNGLRIVAADGLPLPTNSAGPNLYSVDTNLIAMNDLGQISFASYDGMNSHLWVDTPNAAPREVASSSSTVPGVPGAKFDYFSDPMLNATGHAAFVGVLRVGPGGVTDQNKSGIWQEDTGGVLKLVARDGQIAPDTGGQTWARALLSGLPGVNRAGQMAFISELADAASSRVIYAQDSAMVLHKIVRSGDPAVGIPGATFVNLFAPTINDAGEMAFFAADSQLGREPYYETGIWSNAGGSFHPVVRRGQSLPGMPAGTVVFEFDGMQFNNRGQIMIGVAFGVPLGDGSYSYSGSGIWAQDAKGVFRTIIKSGDTIDVDPSAGADLRVASFADVDFFAANRTTSTRFNDLGQILLSIDFADGSHGLFVSNAVAVPEPGAACLTVLAVLMGTARKRVSTTV